MSAYATLGTTSQVGGSILHILGENTDYKINVVVRSRSKLEHSYPPVVSNKNIHIFEGSVSDIPTLASCTRLGILKQLIHETACSHSSVARTQEE